jgi:hypothetical protein
LRRQPLDEIETLDLAPPAQLVEEGSR